MSLKEKEFYSDQNDLGLSFFELWVIMIGELV